MNINIGQHPWPGDGPQPDTWDVRYPYGSLHEAGLPGGLDLDHPPTGKEAMNLLIFLLKDIATGDVGAMPGASLATQQAVAWLSTCYVEGVSHSSREIGICPQYGWLDPKYNVSLALRE